MDPSGGLALCWNFMADRMMRMVIMMVMRLMM